MALPVWPFVIEAPRPSLKRYRSLFPWGREKSVLRTLQYERLASLAFKGKTLGYGGGARADYHSVVPFERYDSVNIDSEIEPTWSINVGDPIPVSDATYDTVLSLNTFEHIYDVDQVLREIARVTKPGGRFVASVPFLHQIHAHPNDFIRPTPGWWYESLTKVEFEDIEVEPLAWGAFSTGFSCSGKSGPFKRFRKHIALLMDIIYTNVRRERSQSAGVLCFSVGFFVTAKLKA